MSLTPVVKEKFQFSFCNIIAEVVAQIQTEIYGRNSNNSSSATPTLHRQQSLDKADHKPNWLKRWPLFKSRKNFTQTAKRFDQMH